MLRRYQGLARKTGSSSLQQNTGQRMVRALAIAAAVAGLASPALAFQMPAPVSRPSSKLQSDAGNAVAAPEYSKSVPFLLRPKNLEGMVGDVGFDPFGFSEYLDVKVLREGELKNGRVAMLAVVGFIVQQFVRLPGELYSEPNPVKAFYKVGPQPLLQIIIFCGVLEFILHKGKVTTLDMFSDPKREPGNFGFDPLGLGKDPAKRERYALSELKNGRLAMLAIGGLVHHALITGEGGF